MDITLQILNPEESDFLNACINNERWAQKKLYEDNYASMMSLSMRYANNNDDALDILHESFIKIFRNFVPSINTKTNLLYFRVDNIRNILVKISSFYILN